MSISERPECFQVYLNIRSGSSSSTSPNPAPSDVMPPRLTSLSQSPSPKIQSIFHSTMTSLGLKEQGGDHNSESLQTGKKASKVFMSQQRLSRRISMESRTGSLGDGETLTTGSAQSPSLPFESSLKKQETKKKIKSRLSMLQSTLTDFMSDTNRSSFLEVEGKKDEGLELSRFPDSVQKKDRAALNQPSDSSQKLKALFENLEADLVTLESGEDLSEIHVPRGRLRTPEELAASKTILYSDVSTETMETLEIIGLMSKNLDSLILQAAQVYGIAPSHQEV